MQFIFPNTFDLQLVASTDVETKDMGRQLTKIIKYTMDIKVNGVP
jgi:hypothetical protein